jgi:hypothetical protein
VALVKADISEERSASIIKMDRIAKLGTTLAENSKNVLQLLVTANIVHSSLRIQKTTLFIVANMKTSNLT